MKALILAGFSLLLCNPILAQEEEVEAPSNPTALSAKVTQDKPITTKQTKVDMSSHSFVDGVHTTFAVTFQDADAKQLEGFWKKQLKDMCDDLETKKQLTAHRARVPSIHTDTINILGLASQPKKSSTSTMHLAFIVNNADVGSGQGPDEETRINAAKEFVYTRSVQFKRELLEAELEDANKSLERLEKAFAGLEKEKLRAEKSMQKNMDKGAEAEKDKSKAVAELKSLATQIETKQAEVGSDPSEANTAALNEMLGDREKATNNRDKAEKSILSADKKVEDLKFAIKKNIEDQANTKAEIETAKEVVKTVTKKLADLN